MPGDGCTTVSFRHLGTKNRTKALGAWRPTRYNTSYRAISVLNISPMSYEARFRKMPKKRHDVKYLENFSIHISPSFEPHESFQLVGVTDENTGQNQYYLLTYECSTEEDRIARAKGQVQLSQNQADAIFTHCQNMKIGLIPEFASGLDGTTTTVAVTQGWNRLEIKWWPEAPKPWKPVEKLIAMLRQIATEDNRKNKEPRQD